MKVIAKALVCAATLATFSVQAQYYVGGSIGRSDYKGPAVGGASTDTKDTGGKIYGGYTVHPNVGIELGYARLGKFTSSAGQLKQDGIFVDAVGNFPFTQSLSGLARVGVFNGKSRSTLLGSDRGTNYKVGAGLQWDFNKSTGVRGEWERYRFDAFGTKSNTDLVSVGVNHRF